MNHATLNLTVGYILFPSLSLFLSLFSLSLTDRQTDRWRYLSLGSNYLCETPVNHSCCLNDVPYRPCLSIRREEDSVFLIHTETSNFSELKRIGEIPTSITCCLHELAEHTYACSSIRKDFFLSLPWIHTKKGIIKLSQSCPEHCNFGGTKSQLSLSHIHTHTNTHTGHIYSPIRASSSSHELDRTNRVKSRREEKNTGTSQRVFYFP
jgi:hypothetical protein